jgi:DNA adenine methylase
MTNNLQPPLKWHGGKHYLAKRIVELMPPHTRYVEPYCGGMQVLFAHDPDNCTEVVNDINKRLMNFWTVLKYPVMFEAFSRAVTSTPLSEAAFQWSIEFDPDPLDPVTDALAFFVQMRQSRQGLGKHYCTPTSRTRRRMNENVSAWLTAVEGLPDIHDRLKRVEVWNRDAVSAIEAVSSDRGTLVYCDPPYIHSTRTVTTAYQHEMDDAAHEKLLKALKHFGGLFILSGYDNALYYEYEMECGWNRQAVELPNNASSAREKERKLEILWTNF